MGTEAQLREFYGGEDPRRVPLYSVGQAAHHLDIHPSTIRSWLVGREGPKPFERVIVPADSATTRLSFENLVELHVLSALREHLSLPKIRAAMKILRAHFKTQHPLADVQLLHDQGAFFYETLDALVALGDDQQIAFGPIVGPYLERIERDPFKHQLQRLYPFVADEQHGTHIVAIDPLRKFGQPYLVGAGVETSAIKGRYLAGEPIAELAADYDTTEEKIEGALRFERALRAAA